MIYRKLFLWSLVVFICMSLSACRSAEEKRAKFYNKGLTFYEAGDYDRARIEFSNAIQIDSKYAESYHMLGMTHLKKKNYKKAYGSFKKAVDISN